MGTLAGKIKKETEFRDEKNYYKVMIKGTSIFSMWKEEFGSFNKKQADVKFEEIAALPNIEVQR